MQEKRQHPRTTYIVPVEVQLPEGKVVEAQSHDMSLGGMFLYGNHIPPIGTKVIMTFDLKGFGQCSLPGYVRWIKEGGYGVQFGLLGVRETHAMGKLVRGGQEDS